MPKGIFQRKPRTRCKSGLHDLAGDNLQIDPKTGKRRCRSCTNERKRKNYVAHPLKPITHCKKGHELAGDNLYTTSEGKRRCRICSRERSKKWEQAHPEPGAERRRKFRELNPDYQKEWAADNHDKVLSYKRKRRAREFEQLGLWNHMESQVEELMYRSQEGRCYYCNDVLDWEDRTESPLEHKIPLSRGKPGDGLHGILNWCISCRSCNSRKGSKTVEEFLAA